MHCNAESHIASIEGHNQQKITSKFLPYRMLLMQQQRHLMLLA